MIFDDFISPCQNFDEKVKGKKPAFIRKDVAFLKKKITDMVSWKKLNAIFNLTGKVNEHDVSSFFEDWKNTSQNIVIDQHNFNDEIFSLQEKISNHYGDEYTCDVDFLLCRCEDSFSDVLPAESDVFYLQIVGSSYWEVFPRKRKNSDDVWLYEDEDFYIPIIDKSLMESDILYVPKNVFYHYRPRSASIIIRFSVHEGTKKQKKTFYDFMPVRGKILNEDLGETFNENL